MNISAYILEYLKQFGSVTVPGFGVFSLENSKAIINSENGSILPPAGQIAFTADYDVQSDELATFISAQKQMSLEASKSDLKIQTDFWKKKLQADQVLEIQSLGTVSIVNNEAQFKGKRMETDHPDYYGLEEIRFSDISSKENKIIAEKTGKDYQFNKSVLWIFLFIIPVLGILYFAFTQQEGLFGKKSFGNIPVQPKAHKVVKDTIKLQVHTPQNSDSLKKDSAMKPMEKGINIQTTSKQH
jgi:nucleoid DNA-binding protein